MTNLFVIGPPAASPCVRNACTACCRDTNMPLTLADIDRLTAAGHRLGEFSVAEADGWVRLRNLDDHRCFFLSAEGRCRVHDDKPEGCRLYPFILDEGSGRVFRDDFCPHRAQFRPPPGVEASVTELVGRLESEAARRRGGAAP